MTQIKWSKLGRKTTTEGSV